MRRTWKWHSTSSARSTTGVTSRRSGRRGSVVESGSVGAVWPGVGCARARDRPARRTAFVALAAIVAVLFALGTQGPDLPVVAPSRCSSDVGNPAALRFVLSFTLAIAAGLGMQCLIRTRAGRIWGHLAIVAALAIGLRADAWAALDPDAATSARLWTG